MKAASLEAKARELENKGLSGFSYRQEAGKLKSEAANLESKGKALVNS